MKKNNNNHNANQNNANKIIKAIADTVKKPKINKEKFKALRAARKTANLTALARRTPAQYANLYRETLLRPEYAQGARAPGTYGQSTATLHRHLTVPISTNASGQCGFAFVPQALIDNSTNFSVFYASGFNTGNTGIAAGVYTTNNSATTFIQIPVSYSVSGSTVQSWRLVSASMQVRPATNLLNNSGQIYLGTASISGLIPTANNVAAYSSPSLSAAIIPNAIENLPYNCLAHINANEYARAVWVPSVPDDFNMYPMNGSVGTIDPDMPALVFVGSIIGTTVNGTPAATPFNVEIYLNYELMPTPGTSMSGSEQPTPDITTVPATIVAQVRAVKTNLAQTIKQ